MSVRLFWMLAVESMLIFGTGMIVVSFTVAVAVLRAPGSCCTAGGCAKLTEAVFDGSSDSIRGRYLFVCRNVFVFG